MQFFFIIIILAVNILSVPTSSPGLFPHKKRPTLFLRAKPWGRGCFSPRVFVRISLRALGSSGRKRERARARETREG